jgi:hypothetical protein
MRSRHNGVVRPSGHLNALLFSLTSRLYGTYGEQHQDHGKHGSVAKAPLRSVIPIILVDDRDGWEYSRQVSSDDFSQPTRRESVRRVNAAVAIKPHRVRTYRPVVASPRAVDEEHILQM